ncbi:hypothetical protein [Botryobacter ruber]|uniref:hypothetical protein n=1 Tax=Botryobacter ruber TaxID=2171629 RepID=UPI000E09EA74|nr:hypothetical protein [Botryobacter ruber]
MNSRIKNQLLALSLYQIIGGLLGIALTVWVLFSGEVIIDQSALRISLFATALFVFSIICGSLLLRNPLRGLRLSLLNQVLQVIYFSFGAYSFQYVAGLRIGLGFDLTGSWTFKFRLALSSFRFDFGTATGEKFLGINLLALFLIFWVEQLLERVRKV